MSLNADKSAWDSSGHLVQAEERRHCKQTHTFLVLWGDNSFPEPARDLERLIQSCRNRREMPHSATDSIHLACGVRVNKWAPSGLSCLEDNWLRQSRSRQNTVAISSCVNTAGWGIDCFSKVNHIDSLAKYRQMYNFFVRWSWKGQDELLNKNIRTRMHQFGTQIGLALKLLERK